MSRIITYKKAKRISDECKTIYCLRNPYGYLISISHPLVYDHWETWKQAWDNAECIEQYKLWAVHLKKKVIYTEKIWDDTERRLLFEKTFMETGFQKKYMRELRDKLGELGFAMAMEGLEIGREKSEE